MYNPGFFGPRQESTDARKESRKQEAEENDDLTQKGRREEDSVQEKGREEKAYQEGRRQEDRFQEKSPREEKACQECGEQEKVGLGTQDRGEKESARAQKVASPYRKAQGQPTIGSYPWCFSLQIREWRGVHER